MGIATRPIFKPDTGAARDIWRAACARHTDNERARVVPAPAAPEPRVCSYTERFQGSVRFHFTDAPSVTPTHFRGCQHNTCEECRPKDAPCA